MQPINWGVLGASKFAREQMARAIHEAEGARLAALATSDPARAAAFRAFCPELRLHDSYAALIDDPAIDAVYIPLPNHLHVAWTERALRAGKHVLTEKPIALTSSEIDGLIALRDRTGLVCTEAYMIVHHPQWHRARALLEEGAIGRLRRVDGTFSYMNRDASNIRNRPETGGGGIRDIGVYPYGAARWMTGAEPVSLSARVDWENGVDTLAEVAARMAGPGGDFSLSALTAMRLAPRQEMVFHGEGGVLRLTAPFNPGSYGEAQVHLFRPGQADHVDRFPGVRQYRLQVEAFGRAVRTGAPLAWRLEDARGTQAMIDRVFAAAGPAPAA